MSNITAGMVKDLRERTGAGMMDCKKALVEANGDLKEAEKIIAKSGHKKAAKSAARVAAEGKILLCGDSSKHAMLEINSETDFVARDENFLAFGNKVCSVVNEKSITEMEALANEDLDGNTVEESRKSLIAKIGENIQLRRATVLKAESNQTIGAYSHQGRIGTLVLLEGGSAELAKDIAMHIAAMKPQYIATSDVPADVVAEEKEILVEKAKKSGKPENIIEKIVSGQLSKSLNEICLVGQPFFRDPDSTIDALLKKSSAKVASFVRFEVGEGIEVKKMSFHEEVMMQTKGA